MSSIEGRGVRREQSGARRSSQAIVVVGKEMNADPRTVPTRAAAINATTATTAVCQPVSLLYG